MSDLSSLLAPIRKRASVSLPCNGLCGTRECATERDRARLLSDLDAVLALADEAYSGPSYVLPGGYPSRPVEVHAIRAAVTAALGEQA
jgi:hypothetical protein